MTVQVTAYICEKCSKLHLFLEEAQMCCIKMPKKFSIVDILLEAVVGVCRAGKDRICPFGTTFKPEIGDCCQHKGCCSSMTKEEIMRYVVGISKHNQGE